MKLAQIIERFKGDLPEAMTLKRRAWETEKQPYSACYHSSGNFYTSREYGSENYFPFDTEDLTANDWAYTETVWVTK